MKECRGPGEHDCDGGLSEMVEERDKCYRALIMTALEELMAPLAVRSYLSLHRAKFAAHDSRLRGVCASVQR